MNRLKTKILKKKDKVKLGGTEFLFMTKFHCNLPDFSASFESYNSKLMKEYGDNKFNKFFDYTLLYDNPQINNEEEIKQSAKEIFGDLQEFEPEIDGHTKWIYDKQQHESQDWQNWANFLDFNRCTLAQSDPLGQDGSEVVETFKGYLELNGSYGMIVDSEYCNINRHPIVFVTQGYIDRYKLRNGDQILCACKQHLGNRILKEILAINEIPYNVWKSFRSYYTDLKLKSKHEELDCLGEFVEPAIKEFKLLKGDTVFMYIEQGCNMEDILKSLTNDIIDVFDKIIYINPNYINHSRRCPDDDKIIKFCTRFDDDFSTQANIALLGINHAKRLVELGQKVAIIIDDINTIAVLDRDNETKEMPISKNILNSAINTEEGSINMFTIIPVRQDIISGLKMQDIFRSIETMGWVIKNNKIDISRSFRTR